MNEKIKTVSEITSEISRILNNHVGYCIVKGEISNFLSHSSGHRYFSVKDSGAQLSCVMWRSRRLTFQPSDGMEVVVRGNITVYPPRGQYQMDLSSMTPLGEGNLYLAYEALKKKLSELGYFDVERKKRLPDFPLNIGVATSGTGAAQRDIKSTIERRFPLCTVYFRNTIVQGDAGAEDIAAAIKDLHDYPVDVIIIGRGGGSLEDLWPFNTEIVANAIYDSKIPIVSAVGHETDFSISDFVADVRAATPTAAAEIVTTNTSLELLSKLEMVTGQMTKMITDEIYHYKDLLDTRVSSYSFRSFRDKLSNYIQEIDEFENDLGKNCRRVIEKSKDRLESYESRLRSLYPLNPLNKGFALLKSGDKILMNSESLKDHKEIIIERAKEIAQANVASVKEK